MTIPVWAVVTWFVLYVLNVLATLLLMAVSTYPRTDTRSVLDDTFRVLSSAVVATLLGIALWWPK